MGAHPDDVEIGAAGALLAHRAAGHEIAILTMSRGARGGPDDARAGESREAAPLLGAELYLEDMEDTRISESDPTISAIRAVVEAVQPTMLYTHSIHDVHQDHRNTHRAVDGRGPRGRLGVLLPVAVGDRGLPARAVHRHRGAHRRPSSPPSTRSPPRRRSASTWSPT